MDQLSCVSRVALCRQAGQHYVSSMVNSPNVDTMANTVI